MLFQKLSWQKMSRIAFFRNSSQPSGSNHIPSHYHSFTSSMDLSLVKPLYTKLLHIIPLLFCIYNESDMIFIFILESGEVAIINGLESMQLL